MGHTVFTCKQHHACLLFVSIYQMAPPQLRQQISNCSLLLIYRPQRDERLNWPGWLTHSRRLTHISGHPSATGWAQDSERLPANDRRYTAVPHNQPMMSLIAWCLAVLLGACLHTKPCNPSASDRGLLLLLILIFCAPIFQARECDPAGPLPGCGNVV